jgi:hypothetical protein
MGGPSLHPSSTWSTGGSRACRIAITGIRVRRTEALLSSGRLGSGAAAGRPVNWPDRYISAIWYISKKVSSPTIPPVVSQTIFTCSVGPCHPYLLVTGVRHCALSVLDPITHLPPCQGCPCARVAEKVDLPYEDDALPTYNSTSHEVAILWRGACSLFFPVPQEC